MYVERDDFLEHEREFRTLRELAERYSIPLTDRPGYSRDELLTRGLRFVLRR